MPHTWRTCRWGRTGGIGKFKMGGLSQVNGRGFTDMGKKKINREEQKILGMVSHHGIFIRVQQFQKIISKLS